VSPGGPAEAAGIDAGDRIVTLDGHATRGEELSAARTLLRTRPDGSRITLDIRHGDELRSVVLVLRDRL
jgi:C-terminal processing protease CtpA/Prc